MSVYKIWHDAPSKTIVISGLERVFPEGSLKAVQAGNKITIETAADGVKVLLNLDFSRYAIMDGTPFTDVSTAMAYLTATFTEIVANDFLDQTVTLGSSVPAFVAVEIGGIPAQPTMHSASLYLGVTLEAGAGGDVVPVRKDGSIYNPLWLWTPGQPVYFDTAGVLTQSLPTPVRRRIGYAHTATQLNLDPNSFPEFVQNEW